MIDPSRNLVIVYLTNKINSPVTDPDTNLNRFDGNHPFVRNAESRIDVLRKWAFAAGNTEKLQLADSLRSMLPTKP